MVRKQLSNLLFLCLFFSAFISGCVKGKGGASSEGSGDSQDSGGSGGGTDDLPIPISGTNIIRKLRVGNGRVLSYFTSTGHSSYKVVSQAAVVDETGNQQFATAIEDGVQVNWKEPVRISGALVLSQSCQVSHSKHDQECYITVQGSCGAPTQLKVDLDLLDTKTNESNTEFSLLYLPFSVESFGFAPQVPGVLASVDVPNAAKGIGNVSLINRALDPLHTYFGEIRSACESGSRIYFEAGGQIFLLEKGIVRLFAGSGSPNLSADYSHPLRTFFIASSLRIACASDALFVLDGNRIFRVTDTAIKPVNFDPNTASGAGPNAMAPSLLYFDTSYPKEPGFVMVNDKTFYVSDSSGILKIFWEEVMSGNFQYKQERVSLAPPLSSNEDLALGDGFLYVVERQGAQVRKISLATQALSAVASPVFTAYPLPTETFPRGIAYNPDGTLYLSDTKGARIVKVGLQGQITPVSISGGTLSSPRGLTRTSNGSLLIADGSYLKWLDPNGVLRILAGTSKPIHPESGKKGAVSSIDLVTGIALLPSREIIFNEGHHLRKIQKDGVITTIAGAGSSYANQIPASESALGWIDSTVVAPDGTVYFTVGNQIKKIDPNGILSTVAGQIDSESQFSGLNLDRILYFNLIAGGYGLIRSPVFNKPDVAPAPVRMAAGPYTDCKGNAISDQNLLNAMMAGMICNEEMPALSATLRHPRGLALDTDGRTLYIADTFNQRLRKILPNGKIYTILGPGPGALTPLGTGGTQISSFTYGLMRPVGLALSQDQKLYFTEVNLEYTTGYVRRLDLATGMVTQVAGNGFSAPISTFEGDGENANYIALFPSRLATSPDNKIYFIDQKFGLVRSLEPYGSIPLYRVRTVFGLNQTKDCGGGVASGRASKENMDAAIKTSLNAMCAGTPGAIAVRSNCDTQEGTVTMVISQTFSNDSTSGNIIRVERPCGAADYR